eukprot:gi/632963296/ref/XP_007897801.1/ PREDICTED: CMRF35-like molecule 4 [Callorhinchus milii]
MDISLILLFSSLADLLWAEAEVTGVVGRAIRINCRYDEQKYSGHRKYWCRGYYRSSCEDVIDTKAVNGQRGRFSITDKRDGVFTVTMENLTMRDAGWYNCGIDQFGRDTMVAVKVHISDESVSVPEAMRAATQQTLVSSLLMDISLILLFTSLADLLWAEAKVTGVVGQAIRINCRYDKKTYSGHRKYWCHGYYRSSCEDVIDTKAVNGQRGRFSITDKRDGVFTVTMENLTMRDAGWYNCGIDKPGFDTMVAVKLHISDGTEFSSPKITTKSMPTAHVPAARISFMVTQATIMATKGQQHR